MYALIQEFVPVTTHDDGDWELVATCGPGPRGFHSAAYDSQRERTVLFGGIGQAGGWYGDTWEHRPAHPGDVDGDGDVDLADLSLLLAAYNSCTGDPDYDPDADFDDDGCVDLADLSTLLAHYGDGT